jgi:hypothetical protein
MKTKSVLLLVMALAWAAPAYAQVNAGSFSVGEVWIQLNGPYTWGVDAGSTLPPGLSLRTDVPPWFAADAHAGVIGVATTPGTYFFTLTRSGTTPLSYQMKVTPFDVKDAWTIADAHVGVAYSYQLTALNNAGGVTWALNGAPSQLPPGITLDASGLLQGTPTTSGVYNVNFSLNDGQDTVFRSVTINVFDIRFLTSGALPNATPGAVYNATITAAGGAGGYTFAANSPLPTGLTLSPSGNITGTTTSGPSKWSFDVSVTDTNAVSRVKRMTIVVLGVPSVLPTLTPYGNFIDDCSLGQPCSRGIGVWSGKAPFTWSVSGLPPGMDFRFGDATTIYWIQPGDVELWGSPTQLGTFPVQFTVTDADGATATNTFDVNVRPLHLWNSLVGGSYGVPYSYTFLVIGGTLPYTVADAGGRLPNGLTLNPSTLTVSGTPQENGGFTLTTQFADASGDPTHILHLNQYPYFGSLTSTINFNTGDDLGSIQAGSSYSNQLQACCVPSYSWSIVGGSLPPGLAFSASGVLSGTPPAGTFGTFQFLVRVEDATNSVNFAIRRFQIVVTPIQFSGSTTLPTGNVNTSYNVSLIATGGTAPYTWTLQPFQYLPPGLSLGSDGLLSGLPAQSGQYNFFLKATDSTGKFTTRSFVVSIYPAGVNPPLNLPISSSFTGVNRGVFTQQLQATGGNPPYHYSLTPGAPAIAGMRVQDGVPLPTSFPASVTGGFIGVLTDPGTFTTSIRVTDALSQTFDKTISVTVSPIQILTTNPPRATIGVPYSFTLAGYGGTAYQWSSTSMPSGLSLDSSGVVSGTPTSSGTVFATIVLKDLATLVTYQTSVTFIVDPFAIVTGGVLPSGVVGTFYSQTLSAPGCSGTCTWSSVGGGGSSTNLVGLTLSSGGVLSGTPNSSTNNFFTFQVAGTNGTVQKVFALQIATATPQTLAINTTVFSDSTVGSGTNSALFAQGGTPPYTWSLDSGSLPPGVAMQGPGETVCASCAPGWTYLAGRAMQVGSSTFTLRLTDSTSASVTRAFTWNVSPLSFQYSNLPLSGTVLKYNTAYTQPLLVLGGSNSYTWSSANMPPGLTLVPATGIVTGTPTNTGSFTSAVNVTDGAAGTIAANLSFNIAGPTGTTISFSLNPSISSPFQQGSSPSYSVSPTGGTPPYTITPLGPLPDGFALRPLTGSGIPAGSMSLVGIAQSPGTFSFTLQAQDSLGNLGVRTATFTVVPFALFSSALPDGSVAVAYSHQLTTFGSVVTWSVPSTTILPPGISVSPAGLISGTPTTAGTFSFLLTATSGSVGTNVNFTLRVSNINLTDPPILPTAIVGAPYNYAFNAAGGGASKVWSIFGLPNGLTMSSSGVISGTAQGSGTSSLTLTVTDGVVAITRRYTLPVVNVNPNVLDIGLSATALTDATLGQTSTYTLPATGGVPPYNWAVALGSSLPPGFSLLTGAALPNSSFFPGVTVLSGIPTTAGTYSFDLIATDQVGSQARRTFTLTVSELGLVASLPGGTTGVAYSGRFTAVGGVGPYSYSMTPSSRTQDMLPTGLTMSVDGVISGVPTSTGTFRFVLHAQDAGIRTIVRTFALTIVSPSNLQVANTNPATSVGHGVEQTLSAFPSSGPSANYNWTLVGGAFPPGVGLFTSATLPVLNFNETLLGGQPTAAGTFTYTLRATNAANSADSADHTFTMSVEVMDFVSPPPFLGNNSDLPSGHVGVAYSTALKVAGGTPPYTFTSPTPLPAGLLLSPDGVLSGSPLSIGAFAISPVVTDSVGETLFRTLILFVTPPGVPAPLLPTNDGFINDASLNAPYSFLLDPVVRGGVPPISWAVDSGSTLPPGLSILPGANGVPAYLGGVPSSAGFYEFSLVATDSAGQTLTIPAGLSVPGLSLTVQSIQPGVVGSPYSVSLGPSGGVPPYALQVYPGIDLPVGLSLDHNTGVLSGIPQTAGSFSIGVILTDGVGNFYARIYPITIDNAAGEAPAVSLAPKPIQIYYELGSPSPGPVPVAVNLTSGISAFTLNLTNAPWANLSSASGTAPSSVNLNVDISSLGVGTYSGFLGVSASDAVNRFDITPVVLTVAVPPPCTYAVNPVSGTVSATGGSGSFGVSTGSSCTWTAAPSDPWITITSGAAGTGVGPVAFSATPNLGVAARVGTINVNGAVYGLTQFGSACSFAISPASLTVSAAGASGPIGITASDSSCVWAASGLSATPGSGMGSGSVTVTIPPNPDPGSRQLTATIAGHILSVDQGGVACTVGLDASAASYASGGGSGAVLVTTPAGCGYGTVLGPSWISVTSGGSGAGSGTLVYSVAPNPTTFARSGSLVIGGQLFSISQEALACSITVDTSGLGSPYGPAGGVGNIGVTANGSNCSWTASSADSWAAVVPQGGTGNGTVIVSIASNGSSPTARSTELTVGGQTIGISQNGTVCTYSLQSSTASVPGIGGGGSVGVVAASACTWESSTNDPTWLTITSSGSAGSSDVQFVAQANPTAAPRIGTLTIAGLAYTVNQAGAACTYTLSSSGVTVSAGGGADSFTFTPGTGGCSPPDILSFAGWVHITPSGNAVAFTVDPNPFAITRAGVIQVANQVFTVTQLGSACAYSLNNYGRLFNYAGGSSTVLGSPSGLGCTPEVGTDQPSIITLGTLTGPLLNIFTLPYDVAVLPPPLTPFVRRMNITFGGRVFVVKQTSW